MLSFAASTNRTKYQPKAHDAKAKEKVCVHSYARRKEEEGKWKASQGDPRRRQEDGSPTPDTGKALPKPGGNAAEHAQADAHTRISPSGVRRPRKPGVQPPALPHFRVERSKEGVGRAANGSTRREDEGHKTQANCVAGVMVFDGLLPACDVKADADSGPRSCGVMNAIIIDARAGSFQQVCNRTHVGNV